MKFKKKHEGNKMSSSNNGNVNLWYEGSRDSRPTEIVAACQSRGNLMVNLVFNL